METLMIKNDGKIISSKNIDDSYEHILTNLSKIDAKEIRNFQLVSKKVISSLDEDALNKAVELLKGAISPLHFARILKGVEYKKIYRNDILDVKTIYQALNGRLNLPASLIIAEDILCFYFINKLSKFKDSVRYLEAMNNAEAYNSILIQIGEEFDQRAEKSGLYILATRAISSATHISFMRSQHHLCFDCQNSYPSKCNKVADLNKKTIDKYDFIKNGYQTIGPSEEVDDFIVTKCDNFNKDGKVKKKSYK